MEGVLQLRKNKEGGRHRILYPKGLSENIDDGDIIEVWVNGTWFRGQYRSDLCPDEYSAYFVVNDHGDQLLVKLDPGLKARLVK